MNHRPLTLSDYVGQTRLKEHITVLINSSAKSKRVADHLLLYGPPGLGKTSLASIIAHELEAPFKVTTGTMLERVGDLVALLTSLPPQSVLFIDEIHRLKRPLEEALYSAMEDFTIDVIFGTGAGSKSMRLNLPPFMLIGATTRLGAIARPLRDRFGSVMHLDYYTDAELVTILTKTAQTLPVTVSPADLKLIAQRSRQTPRIALRILKRVRDYTLAKTGADNITAEHINNTLRLLHIDDLGLDKIDLLYLTYLAHQQHNAPTGISTIAAALNEERETLEDVVEPYLLQLAFIKKTPRGRVVTDRAIAHLGLI